MSMLVIHRSDVSQNTHGNFIPSIRFNEGCCSVEKKHKHIPGNTLKGHNRMIVVFVFQCNYKLPAESLAALKSKVIS